ncbi:MAG: hypothetical protein CVT48_04585 [Thermoplasmata archaeon HGW-Thermoplasmata-1]|nr:MAG: hypothetical protein CVT48_04585 [Thermoplasmata archaeon HGW-Thermoplasmata-1]
MGFSESNICNLQKRDDMKMKTFCSMLAMILMLLPAASVLATPVATDDTAYSLLGRVFPEAESCVGFITIDEFSEGMFYLQSRYPDKITINVLGTSAGGLDVYQVEVTDKNSPVPYDERDFLFFSLSIHGNERGGAEGGCRFIEDIAMSEEPEIREALKNSVILFNFLNPDGWAAGDISRLGPLYDRGNANGVDLNRNWPVVGWIPASHTPLSEPEVSACYADTMARMNDNCQNFTYGGDIHGMLDATDAVDIMMPAGEFDFKKNWVIRNCAEILYDNMCEGLVNDSEMAMIMDTLGVVSPCMWGTCWDALAYTDSGFLGDWMTQDVGLNVIGLDFELILNHYVPNNAWFFPLAQLHITATRIILRTMLTESTKSYEPWLSLPGKVGYIHNPATIPRQGSSLSGGEVAYKATSMRFMEDLDRYTTQPVEPITVSEIISGKTVLSTGEYSSIVIINDFVSGNGAYIDALRNYVGGGGTLLITDGAARLLPILDICSSDGIIEELKYAGYVDILDWNHPLVKDVRGVARQTYEPTPIGFSIQQDSCPVWTVNRTAWEAKGGSVVATTGDGMVSLGSVKLGLGEIVFFGAALPDPSQDENHPYGLSDYALTYSGYQIITNAIGGTVVWENDRVWDEGPDDDGATPKRTPGFEAVFITLSLTAVSLAVYLKRRKP